MRNDIRARKIILKKVAVNQYKKVKLMNSNIKGVNNMACEAMSPLNNRSAFIVRPDKAEEFLNLKPNKKKIEEIMKRAERFEKNIIHED